jgi:mannose-1-phosphate guanylyltransferase
LPESSRSSTGTDPHVYVTVLAGGIGSRFWPASTPARPKQLLPLASDEPLIVDTVNRALGLVPEERIRILASDRLTESILGVLPGLGREAFMVEPQARGTGPVLAWAAWEIAKIDPDAVIISLHADHIIEPKTAFVQLLRDAAGMAQETGHLFTVSVLPSRPETGYGYIEPGKPLVAPAGVQAFAVGAFHEKPDLETAHHYIDEGHFWNSGIFVWTASAFLSEVKSVAPEIGDLLPLIDDESPEAFFAQVPNLTVDVAVLERSARVASVAATFAWDDVGSWEGLTRSRAVDPDGNVVVGSGHIVDGKKNVVYAEGGTVVTFGVDNIVVVQCGEITLVTTAEQAPDLKRLLEQLPPSLREPTTPEGSA